VIAFRRANARLAARVSAVRRRGWSWDEAGQWAGWWALAAVLGIAAIPAATYAAQPRQLAARPIAEDMYATPASTSPKVSFEAVSATQLGDFSAGLAVKCQSTTCGGFAGIRSLTMTSVKVSKKGTFKVSGDLLTAENKKIETETVTRRFVSARLVKGTVTTHAEIGGYEGVTDSYIAVSELVPGHG
jgi:hypothetical protein